LFSLGYNCHLLSWDRRCTREEILELDSHIDFWVTCTQGFKHLHYGLNAVQPERVVVILHSIIDVIEHVNQYGTSDFEKFLNYGATSQYLVDFSLKANIKRTPVLTPLGINYHTYYAEPSKQLQSIGYAGKMTGNHFGLGSDIKRGYLVQEVANRTGLQLKVAETYHKSFISMSGFYKNVDCVIMSSSEEGGGLPVLEAGAAGKLVLGTPVGHWLSRVADKGGITMPIREDEFVNKCVETLTYYKNNPNEYINRCLQIREHAKSYDWSNYIEYWLKVLQ
jgi:glycosyltransferase involved in cell wall biosynthesis